MNNNKYAFFYVICVAFVSLVREKLMLHISPFEILFFSSSIACIYFHILCFKRIKEVYLNLLKNKILFLNLNLIILLLWLSTFLSIYFSSATVFVYEFFTTGGFLAFLFQKDKSTFQKTTTCNILILLIAPFFIYENYFNGILFGILSGIFGYLYNRKSKEISIKMSLSASEILATRFWLLIFTTAVICFFQKKTISISSGDFLNIIFLTFASFILQVWLNQKAVILSGVKKTLLIASFAPFLTFLFEGIISNKWFYPVLFLSFYVSILVAFNLFSSILGPRLKIVL